MRLRWSDWAVLGLAITVVAAAYLYKLGGTPLWGDEAGTGLFARNVLHFGYPTGFDGRNLSIYDGGAELNANLVVAKIPWIQFYLGALSLHVFGNDAGGLRTLFALLGFAALFPMWAALRSRVPCPLFVSTLILVTPQVALFHRSARYYSALTAVFAVLVWIVCSDGLTRARRMCLASACMVLMFHSHPVAAAACGLALLLHAAWRKSHFAVYLVSFATGIASWWLWTVFVGPTLVAPQLFMDFQGHPPIEWLVVLMRNLGASFSDMDAVQGMPLLAWALGLGLIFKTSWHRATEFVKDPFVSFVMLTVAVHTVAVAVLFGTETADEHALLRYMPHLVVFGMATFYILVAKLVRNARPYLVVCLALAATNLLSISFWSRAVGKEIPVSWWPATYQEIYQPQPEAIDAVVEEIRNGTVVSHGELETLLAIPSWLQEVAIFYLGEKFIVVPQIEPGGVAENVVRAKIGQAALARFSVPPKWVLQETPQAPTTAPGYMRIQIPVHRLRPDDGTRPELTRHAFYQQSVVGYVTLYKRLE